MIAVGPEVRVTLEGVERVFPLPPLGVCHIGRGSNNQIVLNDPEASRSHAMIHRDIGARCVVSDAGSRNGTSLNGRSVTRSTELADGDTIRIGSHELVFRCTLTDDRTTQAGGNTEATQVVARHRLISVFVADIRGFTQMSRELGEQRLSALMMRFFADAGAMLEKRGSWAQKYIGDAIMAIWAHASDQVANAELANLLGAVDELRGIATAVSAEQGLPSPLRFGGGINTGYAAVGNMGSQMVADFTALGDTVNKAFRLETASKDLGRDLVIGRGTLDYLVHPLPAAERPDEATITLKGYTDQVPVFALDFDGLAQLRAEVHALDPAH